MAVIIYLLIMSTLHRRLSLSYVLVNRRRDCVWRGRDWRVHTTSAYHGLGGLASRYGTASARIARRRPADRVPAERGAVAAAAGAGRRRCTAHRDGDESECIRRPRGGATRPASTGLIDWLIELWFYVPLDTEWVISLPVFWLGMEKNNRTEQKHAFTNQMYCNAK